MSEEIIVWNGNQIPITLTNDGSRSANGRVQIDGIKTDEYTIHLGSADSPRIEPGQSIPVPANGLAQCCVIPNRSNHKKPASFTILAINDDSAPQAKSYRWVPVPEETEVEVSIRPGTIRVGSESELAPRNNGAMLIVKNRSAVKMICVPQVYRGETPKAGVFRRELDKKEVGAYPAEPATWPLDLDDLAPENWEQGFAVCANVHVTPQPAIIEPFWRETTKCAHVVYAPRRYRRPPAGIKWVALVIAGLLLCAAAFGLPEIAATKLFLHVKQNAKAHLGSDDMRIALESTSGFMEWGKSMGGNVYEFRLPARLLWYRWLSGWNDSSLEPDTCFLRVELSDTAKKQFEPGNPAQITVPYADQRRKYLDRNYFVERDVSLSLAPIAQRDDKPRPKPAPTEPPHQERHKHQVMPHLTPEQQAMKDLCGRAGVPERTENPFPFVLKAEVKDEAHHPGEVTFEFPKGNFYFQLYKMDKGQISPMLGYHKKTMTNEAEPIFKVAGPPNEYEMAWTQADVPATMTDDAGNDLHAIEYILLAVSGDLNDGQRKDLPGYISQYLGATSPEWAITSWKGDRYSKAEPFAQQ